jgi:hypothetical protein
MAAEKYSLSFTKTTRTIVDRLESYGFNIRDVCNAGIILFEKANKQERGMAIAESLSQHKPELEDALKRLKNVVADIKIELLTPEDSAKVAEIRNFFGDNCSQVEKKKHA